MTIASSTAPGLTVPTRHQLADHRFGFDSVTVVAIPDTTYVLRVAEPGPAGVESFADTGFFQLEWSVQQVGLPLKQASSSARSGRWMVHAQLYCCTLTGFTAQKV